MTDKPNIAALRIDERLVHGQGQLWIKTLGVNTVIVANDEAANDPIQQTLMKTVIPKTIAMRFFTVQHTCDVIYKASPKQVMFIICKSAEDALKLVEGGVPVTEINVGNIHRAPGKQEISPYIALGEEDRDALRTLKEKYNVTFNTSAGSKYTSCCTAFQHQSCFCQNTRSFRPTMLYISCMIYKYTTNSSLC